VTNTDGYIFLLIYLFHRITLRPYNMVTWYMGIREQPHRSCSRCCCCCYHWYWHSRSSWCSSHSESATRSCRPQYSTQRTETAVYL